MECIWYGTGKQIQYFKKLVTDPQPDHILLWIQIDAKMIRIRILGKYTDPPQIIIPCSALANVTKNCADQKKRFWACFAEPEPRFFSWSRFKIWSGAGAGILESVPAPFLASEKRNDLKMFICLVYCTYYCTCILYNHSVLWNGSAWIRNFAWIRNDCSGSVSC